ncbi:hypothetical protein M8494_37705 [Serratia ureilytica]
MKQVIRQIDGGRRHRAGGAWASTMRTSAPAPAWPTSPTPTRSWRRSSPAICM